MAVQRIVGRVQVQDDLRWLVRGQKQKRIDKPVSLIAMPGDNLLVAMPGVHSDRRELQAIQRALAGQRLAAIARFEAILPCGIGLSRAPPTTDRPRLVVVVEILSYPNARANTRCLKRASVVCSIFSGSRWSSKQAAIWPSDLYPTSISPKSNAPSIGGDRSAVEPPRNPPAAEGLKFKRRIGTLCFHRAASVLLAKVVLCKTTYAAGALPLSTVVRNAG